jgi:hypothetical protein
MTGGASVVGPGAAGPGGAGTAAASAGGPGTPVTTAGVVTPVAGAGNGGSSNGNATLLNIITNPPNVTVAPTPRP